MSATGVKAGGCSVIVKISIVTVSVVTVGVIVAIAVPLALRNNEAVAQTAETNVTTTPPLRVDVTGTTTDPQVTTTGNTKGDNSSGTTADTANYSGTTTVEVTGETTAEGNDLQTTNGDNSTTNDPTNVDSTDTISDAPTTEGGYSESTTKGDISQTATTNDFTENLTSTTPAVTTTTTPLPTTTPYFECTNGFNRTVILMKANVDANDYLFFRGGLSGSVVNAHTSFTGRCLSVVGNTNPCSVSIQHRTFVSSGGFNAYNAWAVGDNYLDWYGFESTQGEYKQAPKAVAEGSPAVLTTSDDTKPNYLSYNTNPPDSNNNANQSQATPSTSTTPSSTTPVCPSGMSRTVVLIQYNSTDPEVFISGGVPANYTTAVPSTIEISHRELGTGRYFDAYNAWAVGDDFLDYDGGEVGQGQYNNVSAAGSPTVRTSKDIASPQYYLYNTLGDDVYSMEVCMNCSQTYNGWFEVYLTWVGGREPQLNQDGLCSGNADVNERTRNITGTFHIAFCGKLNEFYTNSSACSISNF
ncbi:flocculation protein FLO11-like isoform X2 [Haliotis rufescens]|uniref:flocculation protein FLO11-like isoform X2 n=1 Tax=Haliotis rufescens TaxID=6454 RepID=UPI00201ECC45|nr:flocculation protein FLO11-like isoform X2 [Haliotis rufescens]